MSTDSNSSSSEVKLLSLEEEDDEDDSSSWESLDEDDEDAGQKLSQNSLVLEKVFTHLSVQELLKCRLVCKLWNNTALLQANLGSRTFITVGPENVEQLNQTSEKALVPFCRQFVLKAMDFDDKNILAFTRSFKASLTSLSLDSCSATTFKPVAKLLRAPNLKELKFSGGLPDLCIPLRRHSLTNLKKLELSTEEKKEEVTTELMKEILCSAIGLETICIKNSLPLWKDFVGLACEVPNKVNELMLFNILSPLVLEDFEFTRKRRITRIKMQHCIVNREFLRGLLELTLHSLEVLTVLGSQHEIITRLSGLTLHRLKHLTLPIDGVSTEDGPDIMQSLPNLREFRVVGSIFTKFVFHERQLVSISVEQEDQLPTRFNDHTTVDAEADSEKRREFHKILKLFFSQPVTLRVNMPCLSSHCLRRIYGLLPDLQELVVENNSRNCLDGWTGIPLRTCRKLSACRSFAVVDSRIQRYPSVASLKKLKKLSISIRDEPPKAEFTLLYILYGIGNLPCLEELKLHNFTISDIAFIALNKSRCLKSCSINGSLELWNQFKQSVDNVKVKSFLLPPVHKTDADTSVNPMIIPKILRHILSFLSHREVYEVRTVSRMWHATATSFLHSKCEPETLNPDRYLMVENSANPISSSRKRSISYPSPHQTPKKTLAPLLSLGFTSALELLKERESIRTVIIRGMNKSLLEYYQQENKLFRFSRTYSTCGDRRKIVYWFYPDGTDELLVPDETGGNPVPSSIILIGSWGKKDAGLLEFLDSTFRFTNIVLHGLLQEVYDLILPRLTSMKNIESLAILPFSSHSITEISPKHLQILSNVSFALKNLVVQKLQAPPETVADLIKAHRFTLETLDLQNNVNVSDRLSFSIPHLRLLQLDEPPGVLLWTTLNINQNIESVHFERSGYNYNQTKNKAMPKLDLEDHDFEHSATDMLCDLNLFLEFVSSKKPGAQKSILQEGADSALRFFNHFRFLTSLTLRSVHAHYGVLQGIFRNFTHLEKLVFTNTTGISDEIITGIPKYLLDRVDLMNPLNFKKMQSELMELSNPSIRNLKNLRHLALDDQTNCTDLSVVFGIVRLKRLEYFSCNKWKITDVSVRAIAEMTHIRRFITDATNVSKYAMEYLRIKSQNHLSS